MKMLSSLPGTVALIVGAVASSLLFIGSYHSVCALTSLCTVHDFELQGWSARSLSVMLVSMCAGQFLGGYVAAALAHRLPRLHALAVGVTWLPFLAVGGIPDPYVQPRWFSILVLALPVPVALLGGQLARLRRPGRHLWQGV
jgi:hypothetical protein